MYTASALNFNAHMHRLFLAPLSGIAHLQSSRMTSVALRPGSDSILQMILVIFSLDLSLFGSVNSVVLVHSGSTLQGWNFSLVCLFHFLMHTDALSLAEWQVS